MFRPIKVSLDKSDTGDVRVDHCADEVTNQFGEIFRKSLPEVEIVEFYVGQLKTLLTCSDPYRYRLGGIDTIPGGYR